MTDTDGRRPKSPVEQWFEVFVYAPLGFALDARQLFPRFVDRGRNQVVLAKVIGKYAVEHGSKQVNGYLGQSQTQVAAVLQTLGVLPEEDEPRDTADVDAFEADVVVFGAPAARKAPAKRAPARRPAKPSTPPTDSADPAPTDPTPTDSGPTDEPVVDPGIDPGADVAPESVVGPPVAVPAAGELAIPDYDNLSASQVVPRLEGLSSDELEAVRRYEAAERGRKTILGKIAQLQSA